MDLNQFDILNYLIKGFGLQLKCIQILAVLMESYKHPETNPKVFYKNSAVFNLCLGKIQPLILDVPMEHLSCVTKQVKR